MNEPDDDEYEVLWDNLNRQEREIHALRAEIRELTRQLESARDIAARSGFFQNDVGKVES